LNRFGPLSLLQTRHALELQHHLQRDGYIDRLDGAARRSVELLLDILPG
jgi:hypothetical protein